LEFDDNEFSSGMAGFRSWHGSEVEFNDVAVTTLASSGKKPVKIKPKPIKPKPVKPPEPVASPFQ